MARVRLIKPGFFSNEELAAVSPLGRLMFAGLWTIADREGRLDDRPLKLRAAVLPYDRVDGEKLIAELSARGFIVRYTVDGARYLAIVNFTKHQNPHPKEAASTIPAPEEATVTELPLQAVEITRLATDLPLTSPSLPSSPSGSPDPSDQEPSSARAKRVDEGFLKVIGLEYPEFDADRIRKELAKCQNRKTWDGFKNHQQAFRNWMDNAREYKQRDERTTGGGATSGGAGTHAEAARSGAVARNGYGPYRAKPNLTPPGEFADSWDTTPRHDRDAGPPESAGGREPDAESATRAGSRVDPAASRNGLHGV